MTATKLKLKLSYFDNTKSRTVNNVSQFNVKGCLSSPTDKLKKSIDYWSAAFAHLVTEETIIITSVDEVSLQKINVKLLMKTLNQMNILSFLKQFYVLPNQKFYYLKFSDKKYAHMFKYNVNYLDNRSVLYVQNKPDEKIVDIILDTMPLDMANDVMPNLLEPYGEVLGVSANIISLPGNVIIESYPVTVKLKLNDENDINNLPMVYKKDNAKYFIKTKSREAICYHCMGYGHLAADCGLYYCAQCKSLRQKDQTCSNSDAGLKLNTDFFQNLYHEDNESEDNANDSLDTYNEMDAKYDSDDAQTIVLKDSKINKVQALTDELDKGDNLSQTSTRQLVNYANAAVKYSLDGLASSNNCSSEILLAPNNKIEKKKQDEGKCAGGWVDGKDSNLIPTPELKAIEDISGDASIGSELVKPLYIHKRANSFCQELCFQNSDALEEMDKVADITGMGKEAENLIMENNELLETKDEVLSEQEIMREEIETLQQRVSELEDELKRVKEEAEKATKSNKSDDGEYVPMAQRKNFTRVEMARVLMERNEYKERLELKEAKTWKEIVQASRQDPAVKTRHFSNLFTERPVKRPQQYVNVKYNAQTHHVTPAIDPLQKKIPKNKAFHFSD